MILITGFQHSGTWWMRESLVLSGIDAHHEAHVVNRPQVNVSWQHAPDHESYDKTLLQTRHPLSVLQSFERRGFKVPDSYWADIIFPRVQMDDIDSPYTMDKKHLVLLMWARWNRWIIDNCNPDMVYAVEHMHVSPQSDTEVMKFKHIFHLGKLHKAPSLRVGHEHILGDAPVSSFSNIYMPHSHRAEIWGLANSFGYRMD